MGNNQSDEEGRNQKGNQELYRDKNHTALKHRHKDPIPVKSTACSSDKSNVILNLFLTPENTQRKYIVKHHFNDTIPLYSFPPVFSFYVMFVHTKMNN